SSSSSTLMAAAGAWRRAVDGNSVGVALLVLVALGSLGLGPATIRPSPCASRQPLPVEEVSAGTGGSTLGFSVMIICFLGVFSFFSAFSIAAAAALAAFRSAQRSANTETKWKRGLRNAVAEEKENVVARKREIRNDARRITTV